MDDQRRPSEPPPARVQGNLPVGGIPGALASTSSTSGRIRTLRQRAALLPSGIRISVAQRVQLEASLVQVISAEDIDARQVSAADSTDCLVALCDLCAALGAPLVSRAGKRLVEMMVRHASHALRPQPMARDRGVMMRSHNASRTTRALSSNSSGQIIKNMARAHCG